MTSVWDDKGNIDKGIIDKGNTEKRNNDDANNDIRKNNNKGTTKKISGNKMIENRPDSRKSDNNENNNNNDPINNDEDVNNDSLNNDSLQDSEINVSNELSSPLPRKPFTFLMIDKPQPNNLFFNQTPLLTDEELFAEIELRKSQVITLTKTNQRQQNALDSLSKELTKIETTKSQIITRKDKSRSVDKNNNVNFSTDKERELSSVMSQINMLSKQNNMLKKDNDIFEDYQHKLGVLDQNKMKCTQIDILTNELKILSREVEEHKQCDKKRKNLENELKNVKDMVKQSKNIYQCLRLKLQEAEDQYHKATTFLHEKKPKSILQETISQKSDVLSNNKKRIEKTYPHPNALLSNDERELLQSKISNEKEYNDLMEKITKLEMTRTSIEANHNAELRKCQTKIINQQREIEEIVTKNKEYELKNKLLKNNWTEVKLEQKAFQKKLNDLQTQIDKRSIQLQEKSKEANSLFEQLESLKKIVQYTDQDNLDNEIANYINKIKQDADVQVNGNRNQW